MTPTMRARQTTKSDRGRSIDAEAPALGAFGGRVLVLASYADQRDSENLVRTLAAGERHCGGDRAAMTVVVTVGLRRFAWAMAAGSMAALPPIRYPEIMAESEGEVRQLLSLVGPDVSLEWRCVEKSARSVLKRELSAGRSYAHVCVGYGPTRRSRRAAWRLVREAEGCGYPASVIPSTLK